MVRAGDVIENPVTGETMRFVLTGAETAGELLRIDFRPPGRFAEFITTFFAMALSGKTNARGLPKDVLQLGVTLAEYRDVIRGTAPPWAVQQVLFAVIAPLGRLFGYRPDVPYPGDHERFAPPGPVAQDPFAHSRNL